MVRALVSSLYKHACHRDLYTIFKHVDDASSSSGTKATPFPGFKVSPNSVSPENQNNNITVLSQNNSSGFPKSYLYTLLAMGFLVLFVTTTACIYTFKPNYQACIRKCCKTASEKDYSESYHTREPYRYDEISYSYKGLVTGVLTKPSENSLSYQYGVVSQKITPEIKDEMEKRKNLAILSGQGTNYWRHQVRSLLMQRKLEYRSSQSDTALSKTNVPPPILESNTDVELSKNIAPSTAVHSYTVIDPGSLPISTPTGLNKGTVLTPERKGQTPAFGSLVSNSPVSYSPGTVTPTNLPGSPKIAGSDSPSSPSRSENRQRVKRKFRFRVEKSKSIEFYSKKHSDDAKKLKEGIASSRSLQETSPRKKIKVKVRSRQPHRAV
ncbi:hypothetical protein EB796_006266 [Bugula neritina]|uniref:Uncharacterized protein n=1 Tax=Bugula neritina TaxID=10212 RepID=A0A7J7K9U9_BUGNE|nr:hypothetical protein EB796_006266 [Bugula neritina]